MPEAGPEAGQEQGQGEVWMAKGLNAFLKVRRWDSGNAVALPDYSRGHVLSYCLAAFVLPYSVSTLTGRYA